MTTPTDAYAFALRSLTPMDATAALRRLQALVQTKPDLRAVEDDYNFPPATLRWLGELHAVVSAMKLPGVEIPLKMAIDTLTRSQGSKGSGEILVLLYRALAAAELAAPASEQGAFIVAGNELDAYAAISKVLGTAKSDVLVIDPYMDGKALTDFLPSAAESVNIRLLSDESSLKPTLLPAAERWTAQFAELRPIEIRLAPERSLHDRLIIVDETDAWILTQSLKDFASRAHGSLMRADPESGSLKISAYVEHWSRARIIFVNS